MYRRCRGRWSWCRPANTEWYRQLSDILLPLRERPTYQPPHPYQWPERPPVELPIHQAKFERLPTGDRSDRRPTDFDFEPSPQKGLPAPKKMSQSDNWSSAHSSLPCAHANTPKSPAIAAPDCSDCATFGQAQKGMDRCNTILWSGNHDIFSVAHLSYVATKS